MSAKKIFKIETVGSQEKIKLNQLNLMKDKHIDIDFLGSQDEKLTEKDLAEISEKIKLIRAAVMNG